MPTETVYGLAGLATSDAAVAEIYAVKGRPTFNPLIAHFAELEAAAREARFDNGGRAACRALLAGAADAGGARRGRLPDQPAGARRARHAGAAHARLGGRARADCGGRCAAGGAVRQSLRRGQPDLGGACAGRSRRPHRPHPRRRPLRVGRGIHRGRLPRRAASAAAARRGRARGDRGGARGAARGGAGRSDAASLRARLPRITRRARSFGSMRRSRGTRRWTLPAGSGRASTFRRAAICGRRRRTCSPICARSTKAARRSSAWRRSPRTGLGAAINDRLRRAAAPRPPAGT